MGRGILTGEGGLLSKKAVRGILFCLAPHFPPWAWYDAGYVTKNRTFSQAIPEICVHCVLVLDWRSYSLDGNNIVPESSSQVSTKRASTVRGAIRC